MRVRGAGWSASIAAGSRRFARRDRLAAQITASDRELISQAIAEGRVKRIRAGKSGLPPVEPERRTGRKARA